MSRGATSRSRGDALVGPPADDGFERATEGPDTAPFTFVGVRGCELAAVAVQDHVLRDGAHPDASYVRARAAAFFVGVLARPVSTCFCTSMGTGPTIEPAMTSRSSCSTAAVTTCWSPPDPSEGQAVLAELQEQVASKAVR